MHHATTQHRCPSNTSPIQSETGEGVRHDDFSAFFSAITELVRIIGPWVNIAVNREYFLTSACATENDFHFHGYPVNAHRVSGRGNDHHNPASTFTTGYDPFVTTIVSPGLCYDGITMGLPSCLYDDKMLQDDFGLDWYDYGARFYDPQIGRWHSVDPLAEVAVDITPYHFVSNNPINRIDPTGLTDFALNRRTGEVTQVGEANDEPDRILRTNRKGEVKYKKNGEAKVAMGGIEKGILADGQNWKTEDQIIEVGGEGQPTLDGVQSFTLGLSEYIGKEISGYSYSSNGSGNITDVLLGNYENNTRTESSSSPADLVRKYEGSYSHANIQEVFHTHPDGKLGATQSAPHLSQDVKNLQKDKPNLPNAQFFILYRIQGQSKPGKYYYTHEYRPRIRKRKY